jgi:hypothetical protein
VKTPKPPKPVKVKAPKPVKTPKPPKPVKVKAPKPVKTPKPPKPVKVKAPKPVKVKAPKARKEPRAPKARKEPRMSRSARKEAGRALPHAVHASSMSMLEPIASASPSTRGPDTRMMTSLVLPTRDEAVPGEANAPIALEAPKARKEAKAPKARKEAKAPKARKEAKAPKARKEAKAPKARKEAKEPKPPKAEGPRLSRAQQREIDRQVRAAIEAGGDPQIVAESGRRRGRRVLRILLTAVAAALLAGATGLILDRWVEHVTDTDVPATEVTTDGN